MKAKAKEYIIQLAAFILISESARSMDNGHWYIWFPLGIAGLVMMEWYADARAERAARTH